MNIKTEIRELLDSSITCEMRPKDESLESLEIRLAECKATLKRLNRAIKDGNAKFSEHLLRTIEKQNKNQIENMIHFRKAQQRQGTNGPVNIFDL